MLDGGRLTDPSLGSSWSTTDTLDPFMTCGQEVKGVNIFQSFITQLYIFRNFITHHL